MNLDELSAMIEVDLNIGDDLDNECRRSPLIHAKYLKILTETLCKYERLRIDYNKVYKSRWKYYTNKSPDHVYVDEPLNEKILKTDVKMYMDADEVLSTMKIKVETAKALLRHIEGVLSDIQYNRTKTINAMIDWRKFTAGC